MNMAKTNEIMIFALVGLVLFNIVECDPRIDELGNSSNLVEYQYRYSIDESKSKGPVMDRWEHRIGEYVKGAYSVLEPDGRIRTVDYEVDGVKGYHAVIRMNEPGPRLPSYQQLIKSVDLFPAAAIPTASFKANIPTRNARNDGKIWNYHSRSPYVNEVKSEPKDHSKAATVQISRRIFPTNNFPLSPVNYNVPQTRNLIHFLKPAAYILEKNVSGGNLGTKDIRRFPEKEKIVPNLSISEGTDTEQRRIRNSKLVKRFKSIDELGN